MNKIGQGILIISVILNVVLVYELLGRNVALAPEDEVSEKSESVTIEKKVHESGISYPLMRIVDGDTIIVGFENATEYVRLIGIDAPEPNDPGGPQCYAQESTTHLQELARTGLVTLYFDESQGMYDSYGRLLAYVEMPDGTDLGKQMLADGYAQEFTYHSAYERQVSYMSAETEALEKEQGLWAPDACNIAPANQP
ncbi:MAG: Nuclease (SNase domain protein) [Parcubacteria group bacterium GW2011_GWA2_43_11]|nr:MAG: Nuclease (SNase domain protein) [Parcubacteria group bacterium GW2011_GWC2_42_11]KKS86226.1 MAG: Nuclease (SNase domain protein) [Parcubacteria group bacterium GW2011_GWA2_43_11]